MTNYEPLREMGSFTEEMFNRIIAFQEKEHPAWNQALPFDRRIEGLPLHNLIFSNPDRDPEKFGATVAAYYPLREEMQKFACYIKQLAAQPRVCDLFPGNGFIGSLLGREGVQVLGLQHAEIKPNQIESLYDEGCFSYSQQPLSEQKFDAALVSWPPSGVNPSALLAELQARLIIYVYTDHTDPSSGLRQTGSGDMLQALAPDYREIDSWEVERPKNLLHEVWPDMTPSIEEVRKVKIFAHQSVEQIQTPPALPLAEPYAWEQDLQMALLALQAKREVQARGFPA